MCKEMMQQRARVENELKAELERCLEKISNNGESTLPAIKIDLENLFIANREYFERQGFFFEPDSQRIWDNQIKYYAWIKLGGCEGRLAKEFWHKIKEAQKCFDISQRRQIAKKLGEAGGVTISVNMKVLTFENKVYFEELGYIFEPDIRRENGKTLCYAKMRKKY